MIVYKCTEINGVAECNGTGFTSEPNPKRITRKLVDGISRLRQPKDAGLGDTLERLIAKFGGNKFKNIAKRLGINCGCDDRQKYLNERYPYTTE